MSSLQVSSALSGVSSSLVSPDAVALIEGDKTLTYSELILEADHAAEQVPVHTLVLLMADNTISSLVLYVGLMRKHAVPIMVKREIAAAALSVLIADYQPAFVWCSDSRKVAGTVVFQEQGHKLVATGLPAPELHPDLALLLTTSGSTGSQKYVRLSYENVASNARSIVEYLGISAADRAITTLPFSYSYGISVINSHLLAGASIVLTEKSFFDRDFWDTFKEREVTTFGGVPYTYQMLKRLHFDRMDLPHLRYITQAGGRLGEKLHKEFGEACEAKGIGFVVMYGQTEGTARLSYLPPERCLDKVGSIGIAIPGGSFSLVDADGSVIDAPDVPGELIYRGPNVSLGYASCAADLALDDERHGVLSTGDIAKRDDEGFYYIVGRMKRFLKIFGNRVNLDEVEALLSVQGFVAACAGEDDSMRIYVEQGDKTEVQRFVSETTGLYRGAFKVSQVDALPRNAAGKILYSELEG